MLQLIQRLQCEHCALSKGPFLLLFGFISWTIRKSFSPHSRQHLITQSFTGRMLFLIQNQQCQSTEGKCHTTRIEHCFTLRLEFTYAICSRKQCRRRIYSVNQLLLLSLRNHLNLHVCLSIVVYDHDMVMAFSADDILHCM